MELLRFGPGVFFLVLGWFMLDAKRYSNFLKQINVSNGVKSNITKETVKTGKVAGVILIILSIIFFLGALA